MDVYTVQGKIAFLVVSMFWCGADQEICSGRNE